MYAGWRVCTRDPASIGGRRRNRTAVRVQLGRYAGRLGLGARSAGTCAPLRHGIPGRRALPGRRPAGPTGQGRPGFEAAWQAAASAADARHENQAGTRNGRRFRIRALRSMPFRDSGLLRLQRRATGKLTTLRAGASSGRPAEGHRRRWRRVRARWPTRSSRAWQRSDGRNELGRRPHTAGRAASPARAAGALLPVRLLAPVSDLAAGLRGVPALPGPGCGKRILTRAAWCHFIAGDGRRCLA
jgi:hypothetical protein